MTVNRFSMHIIVSRDPVIIGVLGERGAACSWGRLRKRKIKHVKPGEVAVAA